MAASRSRPLNRSEAYVNRGAGRTRTRAGCVPPHRGVGRPHFAAEQHPGFVSPDDELRVFSPACRWS
jgi:hypothetical protein